MKQTRALVVSLSLATLMLVLTVGLAATAGRRGEPVPGMQLRYGFNVAGWDIDLIEDIGFGWMKVFQPPAERLPVGVLLRVEADASHLEDVSAFGDGLAAMVGERATFVEAYEIGNEVNLGADYGWNASPEAADYVTLLCEAYARIKAQDPEAIVVSAGLAPTGRITGNWEGHAGHNGQNQDERAYLAEFLAAGGAACADAIGYHPYGFSADYDTPPDVSAPTNPARHCENGFCFRGVEKIHEILADAGLGKMPIWATEFGWIVEPLDDLSHCLSDPSFVGREWQLVSEAKQAENLVGAFRYAREQWPWMGAMFVFNLNFNATGWYQACDQMRFYAVEDRPAEEALRSGLDEDPAVLEVDGDLRIFAEVATQPLTITRPGYLYNSGGAPLFYTATVASGEGLISSITPTHGLVSAHGWASLAVTVDSDGRPAGVYSGTMQVEASPGTLGTPQKITVTLLLTDDIYVTLLPTIRR